MKNRLATASPPLDLTRIGFSDIRRRLEQINPQHIRVRTIAATRTNFENEAPEDTARAILDFLGGAA